MYKYIIAFICLIFASYASACELVYGTGRMYKPYEWIDEKGVVRGMNIDLLKAISKNSGCSYRLVFADDVTNSQRLNDGSIDMRSISANDGLYSVIPSMVIYRYIFTRLDSPYISDINDLRGKSVVVYAGTYSRQLLESIKNEYEFNLLVYDTPDGAVQAFVDGAGDALVTTIEAWLNTFEGIDTSNVRNSGTPILPAIYGFHLNKNNHEKIEIVQKAMEAIQADGTYFKILQKWNRYYAAEAPHWYKWVIWGMIIAFIAVIVVLMWNKTLHHLVQRKTRSLSELSNLFQMVLDSIPECIYLINSNSQVSWTNVNNPAKKRYPIEVIKKEIACAIKTNEGFDFTRLSDDAHTWQITAVVFNNNEDRLLVIMYDITENVRLRDEATMAARLAAIGEMAASMAHEINNPTALISLNIGYICRTFNGIEKYLDDNEGDLPGGLNQYTGKKWPTTKAQIKDASETISASLMRIKQAVEDLKAFSIHKNSVFEEIDIRKPLNDALKFTAFFIKKHTNNFSASLPDKACMVYGNVLHIEQVVINLIQNACFALTNNRQAISCDLTLADDGKYVKLTVCDEGCGIPEEIITDIWNPFFTTRKENGGTGLGLAIISRIVKEHNGYHEIKSIKGRGTVISLYFPVLSEV